MNCLKYREINRAVLRGCKGCMKNCQHYTSTVSERVDEVGTGELYGCNSVHEKGLEVERMIEAWGYAVLY